jgi:hypothetical protein
MVTSTMLQQQTAGDFYSAVGRVTHHLILVESLGPGYTSLLNTRADVKAVMGLTGPIDFLALFNRQLAAFNIVRMDPTKFANTKAKRLTKHNRVSGVRRLQRAMSTRSGVTRQWPEHLRTMLERSSPTNSRCVTQRRDVCHGTKLSSPGDNGTAIH